MVLTACGTTPIRKPESAEHLCFGFLEHPRWNALHSESKLVSELREVIAPLDRLAQGQVPPREVVIASARHRHAVVSGSGRL